MLVQHSRRLMLIPALAVAASACAVNPTPVVTGAMPLSAPAGRVAFQEQQLGESETAQRLHFAGELKAAFARHGTVLAQDGALIAEFAISAQPSDLALSEPATATAPGGPKSQLSRKSRWWDTCKVEKIRGNLALFDRASGALKAKSEAEYLACNGDHSMLDDFADLLVKTAFTSF